MRPQRFSCGIVASLKLSFLKSSCFNEAAAFQLRNPSPRYYSRSRTPCFNEAAAFQLRNQCGLIGITHKEELLQ